MDNLFTLDSGVIELQNDFFIRKKKDIILNKNYRGGNLRGLILFYTPWCQSCEEIKYKWSEIALLFKNRFFIGAYNVENESTENDILRNELKITKYPTIKYIGKNGKIHDYSGTRNINDIVHFICVKENINC